LYNSSSIPLALDFPNSQEAGSDDGFAGLQGFPTKIRQSATNVLTSVARIGSSIFQSGIEMAQTMLG